MLRAKNREISESKYIIKQELSKQVLLPFVMLAVPSLIMSGLEKKRPNIFNKKWLFHTTRLGLITTTMAIALPLTNAIFP